jgi:enhancing lycopene biosynthesis protein 2
MADLQLVRNEEEERNYLGEAFRIARGESMLLAEREHLIALIAHCRALVGAAMELPEVA